MRKKNIALFALSAVDHHVNAVTRLEFHLAVAVSGLRDGHHAIGLVADVHHNMGGGDVDDGAFDHIVVGRRGCGFGDLFGFKVL